MLATPGVDVLVVDDSSPDGTGDIVREIAAAASHGSACWLDRRKSGLSSAYVEGFQVAVAEGYDVAIEMDSDLSHDPTELPSLLGAAARLGPGGREPIHAGWLGDRLEPQAGRAVAGRQPLRALMLGLPIHDATSGYRVYRVPLLEALMRRPFAADGYGFQVELVLRSHRLGYAVGESPITFRDRAFGESKISNAIVLEALWKVTRWGFDLRFRSAPRV